MYVGAERSWTTKRFQPCHLFGNQSTCFKEGTQLSEILLLNNNPNEGKELLLIPRLHNQQCLFYISLPNRVKM